jgi:hypothetical protein
MAMFVRGSSKAMFENIFAITNNYSQNTAGTFNTPIAEVFSKQGISTDEAFNKYALTGAIQASYLAGISPAKEPEYDLYFEEFGTIMREAAYFNVRYDKAYPALAAILAPTYSKLNGYVVSNFVAGSYGAEFLVFNATDTILNIDGSEQNNLAILGITFTSESENTFSVDDYFNNNSKLNLNTIGQPTNIESSKKVRKEYQDILSSRVSYGRNAFNLASPYIQSEAQAQELMSWAIKKLIKPRKSVGVSVFGMPTIQLGDIVNIKYKTEEGVDEISSENTKFIVYYAEYAKDASGPITNLFLSEVV